MAEEKGKPNLSDGRRGRRNFFLICEELRNRREPITTARPSNEEACALLGKVLGFTVTKSALKEAKELTGIDWRPRVGGDTSVWSQKRKKDTATLALAVIVLYRRCDENVPTALLDLYRQASGNEVPSDMVSLEKLF